MFRDVSYDPVSEDRPPVPDTFFGQLCRTHPTDVQALCTSLPEPTRAKLAIFCNARAHLRDVGRAIAAGCSRDSLMAEGGFAGAILFGQVGAAPEQWGIAKHHPKRISLAG